MYLLYEILLLRSDTGLKPVIEFVNYYFIQPFIKLSFVCLLDINVDVISYVK